MIGSLYSGISGLKANTDAMSVIGDNIANVNTTGFKSSRASFADVLSGVTGNEIGQGVMLTGQNADWTQGAPESTGNATDLAITGDGLFVVHDSSGVEYYTRAGNFQFDNVGNLVTHDGMIVQGYKIDPATGVLGAVSNISIESGNCSPLVTSEMSVSLNLNADDTNGTDESVSAVLTFDGDGVAAGSDNKDVIYTAVKGGTAGNDISIEYKDSAGTGGLAVSVVGDAITVDFDGDAPTAAEIATAINANADAAALVSATAYDDGAGEVTNVDAYNLISGGGAAALTVDEGTANLAITYTALTGGTAGNDISIEYKDSAGTGGLAVSVVGDAITVDFDGDTPTASEVATAINTNADAASLVSATADGDGSGLVAVTALANLTNGVEVLDNTPDIYSNTITVYDSLGSAVDVTVQYTCVGQGRWVWDATPSDGYSSSTGVIFFDENGKQSYPDANPTIKITGLSNGAEDLEIEWDLVGNDNFTGYTSPSSTSSQTQNGYATGMLQSVSVDNEGFVVKTYSNGQLIPGYRIALAGFSSYAGLARTGGNLYSESLTSGQPIFGIPGNGGLGGINSRSLEMSNVDLATEFVRMITTQRAFQANSRVITTSDEILQELINLKR
ncbi:MAG: flagellar hook-basal body complex protein [Thermodesulfobacteriota bacterium]|nr:flagellar hook-basal body complex protein [Thermodesulfobacteriota bacterium]